MNMAVWGMGAEWGRDQCLKMVNMFVQWFVKEKFFSARDKESGKSCYEYVCIKHLPCYIIMQVTFVDDLCLQ